MQLQIQKLSKQIEDLSSSSSKSQEAAPANPKDQLVCFNCQVRGHTLLECSKICKGNHIYTECPSYAPSKQKGSTYQKKPGDALFIEEVKLEDALAVEKRTRFKLYIFSVFVTYGV